MRRFMKRCLATALLAAAATLLAGGLTQASVIVAGYYQLGESDPGAANGVAGDAVTVDSSGLGLNLTKAGNATYSSSVAASAHNATGSTLSMNFTGAGYYTRTAPLTVTTNNFGVDGWFKVNSLSQQGLAMNGDSWTDGFGLYIYNQRLYGLFGGVTLLDTGITPSTNTWFYAALVRNSSDTKIYYKTDAAAMQVVDLGSASAPNTPTDRFMLGAAGGKDPYASNTNQFVDYFNGSADQVRVFTFASSAFNPSTDLLVNHVVPEPSTLALLGVSFLGLAAHAWRKRK